MLRKNLRLDICPHVQDPHQALHHTTSTVACGSVPAAHFLLINDLTDTATGVTLIVLIVLYVGTQLASSLMATPMMDRTQRQIMLLMPLLFVIFIIAFPSGPIVYWITTNLWTRGQQYVIRRRIGPVVPAPAGTGASSDVGGRRGVSVAPKQSRRRRRPWRAPSRTRARRTGSPPVGASTGRRETPPPPPPRKKKKRSGRRR